ncbi:Arm DNA-binding domain-containing protein [Streptomyces griseus]
MSCPRLRCPGLAIRVAPSGLKTWDFVCRVRGTSTVKRKALGAFPAVSLDEARRRGGAIGDAAQRGKDLIGEEAKAKEEAAARMMVSELIDEYLSGARRGFAPSVRWVKRALAPISNRPIDELRRRDIGRLLNATSDRGVEREAEDANLSALCFDGRSDRTF